MKQMDHQARMLAGLPYQCWRDGLDARRLACKKKIYAFNACSPDDFAGMERILRSILGKAGENLWVEAPFRCDYGSYITVGDNFYANYNLTILDVAPVSIGSNVAIAPNVVLSAAGHPVHPAPRAAGWEYGLPITIADNVWLCAGVIVCPGVTVGAGAVIGAGSVVTRDVPPGVVAAGNPCRVVRAITDAERREYRRGVLFDIAME